MVNYSSRVVSCSKAVLFGLNFLAWLLGLTVFGLGLWIRIDQELMQYINMMDMQYYYNACYLAMTCGIIMFFLGFAGCCGIAMENRCLLWIYFVLIACMAVMEFACAIFVLNNGTEFSKLDQKVFDELYKMLYNYNDDYVRWVMDNLQANIKCCGVDNFQDYEKIGLPIPNSCRDPITGLQYKDDCAEEFVFYLEYKSGLLGGFILGLCVVHIVAMVLTFYLARAYRDEEKFN